MQAYIIRRLLALIPTLFFASLIVFFSMRLIPGSVVDLMMAQNDISTGQDRARIEAALGLDQPIYTQYFRWLVSLRPEQSSSGCGRTVTTSTFCSRIAGASGSLFNLGVTQ